MITLLPIEPLSDAHGMLIVDAFNKLFIDRGGQMDGDGVGYGWGSGDGDGVGYGWGDGDGVGYGDGNVPEAWQED